MASLITGVIGGIQGASAAKHAANAARQGNIDAATTMNKAVEQSNQNIDTNYKAAGAGATQAAADAASGVNAAAGNANARLDPYAANGAQAASTLGSLYGPGGAGMQNFGAANMQADDGYQFRLQQGQQALERAASASGTLGGGANIKGLTDYAQGAASGEYQNAFNRFTTENQNRFSNLDQLSREGQQAAGLQGQNDIGAGVYGGNAGMRGAEYAGNAGMASAALQGSNALNGAQYSGNRQVAMGNAQASGYLGSAQSWNNMLSGIGSSVDSAIAGGFGGGGGFSTLGALSGVPQSGGGAPFGKYTVEG